MQLNPEVALRMHNICSIIICALPVGLYLCLSVCLCVIPRQRHHHTQPIAVPRSTAYSPADGDGSAGGSLAPVIAPLRTCTMLLAAAAAAVVGVCCGGFAKGANSQMVRERYLLTAPRIFHSGNPAEHTLTHGGGSSQSIHGCCLF